jgi:hypothetical protein
MSAGEITWFKRRGAFYTIEIIVESGCAGNEERCRDANEVDVLFEVVFQCGFAKSECFLELETVGEDRFVSAVEAVCCEDIMEDEVLERRIQSKEREKCPPSSQESTCHIILSNSRLGGSPPRGSSRLRVQAILIAINKKLFRLIQVIVYVHCIKDLLPPQMLNLRLWMGEFWPNVR